MIGPLRLWILPDKTEETKDRQGKRLDRDLVQQELEPLVELKEEPENSGEPESAVRQALRGTEPSRNDLTWQRCQTATLETKLSILESVFGDGTLTFQEFAMSEPIPLASIHDAVLDFLRGRNDIAIFGAHAVNAYVDDARMAQDIGILSPRAADLAEELRAHLHERFQIAVRCRTVADGAAHRLYQVRKPSSRHLVDVRLIDELPPCQRIGDVQVLAVHELVAQKVVSMVGRQNTPKGMTDRADLFRLLLAFPELKSEEGAVADSLSRKQATEAVIAAWQGLVVQEIKMEDDDAGF